MLAESYYHKVLRISVCVITCVLLFVSGIITESTSVLSRGAMNYVATAVGMSAGVKPTELNQITAALTKRQNELDAREAALAEREIAVQLNSERDTTTNYSTFILSGILFVLLLLIVLNYVLDFVRTRERAPANQSQLST